MATPEPGSQNSTDISAISAGGLGAVISLTISPGEFGALNLIVSSTLAGVLAAYLWSNKRSAGKSLAVAMVMGLILVPLIGFVDEAHKAGGLRLHFLKDSYGADSKVPALHLVVAWLVLTAVVFGVDYVRQRRNIISP